MAKLKKHIKRFTVLFLILTVVALSFCLTGCLDKNQIETFGFVVALGIDIGENDEIIVNAQMMEATNSQQNSTTGSSSSQVNVYTCHGNTIHNALFNLSNRLSRPLKLSSNEYILVGAKFAETGIQPVIDFSLRFNDMRPTTPIFVTNGKASDILKQQETGNYISPNTINNLIIRQRSICEAPITTNLQFANNMKGNGINTCGVLNSHSINEFYLSGSAVFRKDKLIGYLNTEETRGMQWLKGKVKLGNIIIQNKNNNKVSTAIINSSSKLKPSIKDNFIYITANVKADSNIREVYENKSENMEFNNDPNIIDQLSKEQDKVIAAEIDAAINAAQNKFSADIFGFGDLIYREYPHEWENIGNNWSRVFPHINIKVYVSSDIKQIGALSNVITNEEGK